jgi:hypothetical protein
MNKIFFYLKKGNPAIIALCGIVIMWLFALLSDCPLVKFLGAFWGTIFTVMFAYILCSKPSCQRKG